MRRQICLQACITIPTLGATASLAKLCALLVAARALALAKLCARVGAAALESLAPSTSCGRFSSCVPHAALECLSEGLGTSKGDVHSTERFSTSYESIKSVQVGSSACE